MIVLDASVILKWFLRDEPGASAALELRGHHLAGRERVAVPDLLTYEVANVFVLSARLSNGELNDAWDDLLATELDVRRLGTKEMRRSMALAREARITVYDASYVALAEALGTMLVTADHKLARKLEDVDLGCRILTL